MVEFLKSGITDYESATSFMEQRVFDVISGKEKELVWFLEHPDIYTVGAGASTDDITNFRFPVYQSSRGGKVTHHGPGQRVVYVILDLKKRSYCGIIDYIKDLAQWVILTLKVFGIKAFFDRKLLGIWVYEEGVRKKIAAFGVRVKKFVSYHGFALNVNNDLSNYNGIIPCGISDFGISSMRSSGCNCKIDDVDEILMGNFPEIFKKEPFDG